MGEAFLEKTKKKTPADEKVEIKPADLSNRKSKFEEMKNKANVKVELPTDEPIRRKKKAAIVEEDAPFLQEEEVESAPPPQKDKVSEEFAEKDEKPIEDEKAVIEPKDLPSKEKEESEEESDEESSEDEDNEWNKKPKKSKAEAFLEKAKKKKPEEKKLQIKPADLSNRKSKFEEMKNKANVKVEPPTEQPIRRKKKAPVVEEDVPFLQEEVVESAPLPVVEEDIPILEEKEVESAPSPQK